MLLAEANQWPEDAAAYFGDGDECHMNFHFPIMPRLFMSLQMEDRFPIIDILDQTPAIPPNCQWATFLRNHDELTLEMVTDEERDYMYRVYADDPRARINLGIRRRLAPLLGNNRRRIELINALLFSLPGTPIVYYGDEIGMGDNFYLGDRNGVRTPMQWAPDRNGGFSARESAAALPAGHHRPRVPLRGGERGEPAAQSLLALLVDAPAHRGAETLARLRPRHDPISPPGERQGPRLPARISSDEAVLVVANLSRFTQAAEIDLAEFAGVVPMEIFSRSKFPELKPGGTMFTLGPHDFYWLALRRAGAAHTRRPGGHRAGARDAAGVGRRAHRRHPRAAGARPAPALFPGRALVLGRGAASARSAHRGRLRAAAGADQPAALLVNAAFSEGMAETYLLPLQVAVGEQAARAAAGVAALGAGALPQRWRGAGAARRACWRSGFRAFAARGLCAPGQRAAIA